MSFSRNTFLDHSNLAELFLQAGECWNTLPAFATSRPDRSFHLVSYRTWCDRARALGTALIDLGVKPRDHIGLFSDNRFEWILADAAVQFCGAADVPRGSDITREEMLYILRHADVKILFLENLALLEKLESVRAELPLLQHVILLEPSDALPKGVLSLRSLEIRGEALRAAGDRRLECHLAQILPEDLFTIIYTSGTTGTPKGVQLTHAAMMSQVRLVPFSMEQGERALSILPIWHSYERVFEMIMIRQGGCTYYTSLKTLANDLRLVKPTVMASSPRLWEALYERMMKGIKEQRGSAKKLLLLALWAANQVGEAERFFKGQQIDLTGYASLRFVGTAPYYALQWLMAILPYRLLDKVILKKLREIIGGKLKATISGGGALPPYIDRFFNNIGIPLLEGYGLTESTPVLAVRTLENRVIGTVGPPLAETEIKIIDLATGKVLYPDLGRRELGKGFRGEICVRGPQLMKGYYKDPEGTARVLRDGWLHTGDIGLITFNNCLKLVGRCKETIVLRNGENVEPLPIESRLLESSLIAQCMVVGQDQKQLGLLLVPSLSGLAERGIKAASLSELLEQKEKLHSLFKEEIRRLISAEHGFKPFERVVSWRFLSEPFQVGAELTATYKLKRHVIADRYHAQIEEMSRE